MFTTGLMQEGPSQPVLPQVQSLATCVPGSLFPEDPVAALPWFIALGPRVWAVNEPVVQDKINGFVWYSQVGDTGARSWSLILGKCLMHHLVISCSPN